MEYTPERVLSLLSEVPWHESAAIRIFWVCIAMPGRQSFADALPAEQDGEAIIPIVIREPLFHDANSVLSDVQRLLSQNRPLVERRGAKKARLSVLILAQDKFRFPLISSPITLPPWFPVRPGLECTFEISDLSERAEVALLNCPECRIELLAQLSFEIECELVSLLEDRLQSAPGDAAKIVSLISGSGGANAALAISEYKSHLGTVIDPRAYRPNAAQDTRSILSKLLRLSLRSSPKELAQNGKRISGWLGDRSSERLKPTIVGVFFRPAEKMSLAESNWHAVLLALYQSYQLMNGSAHAGDYPAYPVALLYSHALDLARFLAVANRYLAKLPKTAPKSA